MRENPLKFVKDKNMKMSGQLGNQSCRGQEAGICLWDFVFSYLDIYTQE